MGRECVLVYFGEQAGVVRDSGFGFGGWGWCGCGERGSVGELSDCESDSCCDQRERDNESREQ